MKWIVLAVLAVVASGREAEAQRFTNVTGGELGNACVSQSRTAIEQCDGYLDGVADGIAFYQRLLPADGSKGGKLPVYICVPTSVTGPQLRDAYVTWLRAHKEASRQTAAEAAMFALRDTYKCPQ